MLRLTFKSRRAGIARSSTGNAVSNGIGGGEFAVKFMQYSRGFLAGRGGWRDDVGIHAALGYGVAVGEELGKGKGWSLDDRLVTGSGESRAF